MTAHDLARQLLALPDVPVTVPDEHGQPCELNGVSLKEDRFWSGKGMKANYVTGPHIELS